MKTPNLWSMLLITLTITACEKVDMMKPQNQQEEIQSKAKGGRPTQATFGGQATGINAMVVNTENPIVTSNQVILAQTAPLAATGGTQTANHSQANVSGAVTADSLSASATGQGDRTVATASATNVSVNIAGNVITASSLQSTATAACGPVFTGSSQITNLVINGTAIAVTGQANQFVSLPSGGMVIINEQSTSKKRNVGTITVTALRVILPNGSNVTIASSKAEIKC